MQTADIYIVIGQCALDPTRAALSVGIGLAPSTFTPGNDSVHVTTVTFVASVLKCAPVVDIIQHNLAGCGMVGQRSYVVKSGSTRRIKRPDTPMNTLTGIPNGRLLVEIVRLSMAGMSIRLTCGIPKPTLVEMAADRQAVDNAMKAAQPMSLGDSAIMLVGYDGVTTWQR